MANPRESPTPPQRPNGPSPRFSRRILGRAAQPKLSSPSLRPSGRLSPSVSEVSLASEYSLPHSDVFPRGNRGWVDTSTSSEGSERLICPICEAEMQTLLQLNRHLDEWHAEVESVDNDDIATWFRNRLNKAKSFQPVVALNQKLKGLDVFESNVSSSSPVPPSGPHIDSGGNGRPQQEQRDSDSLVTRQHWQKPYGDDYCLDPTCRRPLGVVNGCVNCRKCGKLFCEEHTMYQIKLSRSAQHEPVRGYWCRVCETCFKSREGYNDCRGIVRDHTEIFKQVRRKKVDRAYLEVSRLEKRLTKLTQLLTSPPGFDPKDMGFIKNFTKNLQSQRRALEQSVVAWEDDAAITNCPYCAQTFSRFTLPKHHCRTCGKVACGDPRTSCSQEIALDVVSPSPSTPTEKPVSAPPPAATTLSIRICTSCTKSLFSARDFRLEALSQPPLVKAYNTLTSFQSAIREMLPRFEKLVDAVQDRRRQQPLDKGVLAEAARTKRRVIEALAKVDSQAKRIRDLSADGPAQEKLQANVALSTGNWGREVGLKVKALSAILEDVASRHRPTAAQEIAARLGRGGVGGRSASAPITATATADKAVVGGGVRDGEKEEKEKELKERIMVLEEQGFLLKGMMEEAGKKRRLDEVAALGRSLVEIEEEAGRLQREVGGIWG